MLFLSLPFVAIFALTHLFIGRLRFLASVPRSRWLSAAGGVAVAYVFLHILPELAEHQAVFAEALQTGVAGADMGIYILALAGLVVFYGLERAAKLSLGRARQDRRSDAVGADIFWLHIASFTLYNVLIGYLLFHREEPGVRSLIFYGVAMALHFVTNDFGLREDHKDRYDRIGRWCLAAAVIVGFGLGATVTIPEVGIGFLFAFLAGGVVLNVLKEELPEERESRFLPFILGTAGYSALMLLV
ncbi:hypothetical protein B7H23_06980 [Notoacmeibacter marinus]|uniref:Uncharacterized protein n=1 Tax=Notoacmeibacter marinus TaxID=1876515 RepID=A0A231V362_9HYPH|nr:hypothetical protein [Notoacmeibacter marinus]OXT02625.1 hypothetical protein B7H23_06980 [Notoacmeibacter marinus]